MGIGGQFAVGQTVACYAAGVVGISVGIEEQLSADVAFRQCVKEFPVDTGRICAYKRGS